MESRIEVKMNQPLLHVMIPAFGESIYLRQTLESAVKHLPLNVPITVIEDPSEAADLESLVKDFPRVHYVKNHSRLGIGGNFNKAIEISTGIFTQICGSDDLFVSDPLSAFDFQNLVTNEIAALALDVCVINEKGKTFKTIPDEVKRLLRPKLDKVTVFENKKIFSK